MMAEVKKMGSPPVIGAAWDEPPWKDAAPLLLRHWMGTRPDHFPKTEVKIAWDNDSVSVMFRVEDRYVCAVAKDHQDSVCKDSCVEFFFTPGPEISPGYFNLEMNCGGTMLFHFHPEGRKEGVEISRIDCESIVTTHQLPRMVYPEIRKTVTWSVAYSLPFSLLERYCPVIRPARHVLWRGNFYKCADNTSHPHWLCWSPVDYPKPDFHLPHFFGVLTFLES
jgi:hypothetical protein